MFFRATDASSAADSEVVSITVNEAGNQTPILAAIGAQSVLEGVNLNFSVSATDPDSTTPSFGASPLPLGASFIDNGDGTGTFDWTPLFTQSGVYNITFDAFDGAVSDIEVVTVTVNEAGNQLPVLAAIGAQSILEGALLSVSVGATDADSTVATLTTSALPTLATFTDNGDGTGTFDWTPAFTQGGIYQVTFYATDPAFSQDSEVVTITVTEAGNQAPALAAIGAQNVTEGLSLNFGVGASDPDSTTPVLTTSPLPSGAAFVDNGNGTGTFSWSPNFIQAGELRYHLQRVRRHPE